jgi:hypothetical protein
MPKRLRLPVALIITTIGMCAVWLLSCSSDSSTKTDKKVYRIMDSQLVAGYYCVCWNQLDHQGKRATAGDYGAHIAAGSYDTTIAFTIANQSTPVPAPTCCDTMTVSAQKPTGQLPDKFGMTLNSAAYAAGDSIAVGFALPVACNCLIEILQR